MLNFRRQVTLNIALRVRNFLIFLGKVYTFNIICTFYNRVIFTKDNF